MKIWNHKSPVAAVFCILFGALLTLGISALDDGEYQIEVIMEGGTGKVTMESPCTLTVADGVMTANVVLSSKNYTYMKIEGTEYYNINESGNATFEIPVAALDTPITIYAETIAMSEPHEIEYTLTFSSPDGSSGSDTDTASSDNSSAAETIAGNSAETELASVDEGASYGIIIIAIAGVAVIAVVLIVTLRKKALTKR